MKNKIAFLIVSCIITVVALASIQGYFIYNTYLLKAKEANHEITQHLLYLETDGKLDTLNNVWMRKTRNFMTQYQEKKATKEDFKTMLLKTSDSLSKSMNKYLRDNAYLKDYDINYSNYIILARMFKQNDKPDTLFTGKLLLYGNNFKGEEETKASQNTWNGSTYDALCIPLGSVNREYEITSNRFYSLSNWQSKIIREMSGLLVFSLLLLSFVVFLFYWSIKNLITQKKIADIKTDFINNITHEFQTPLAALDIAVKTLQLRDVSLSAEQHNTSLDIINRQNNRMQKLFTQVTEASLSPNLATAHVEALGYNDISSIINDFRLSHAGTTIRYEKNDVIIPMDRFHLSTILVNLLDNAVKYGAGNVLVTTEIAGDHVRILVKDDGPGIPEKEQKAIFDKFYRVQKGNIHTTKGLGLGLYYACQVIKAYSGSLTVVSAVGEGATFTISIPLA